MTGRARLLDLTRLVSRVGRGPMTGIDRVEAAYLDRFLADPEPAHFLVATRRRALLLDKPGAAAFRDRLAGTAPWGPPDLVALLTRRLPRPRRLAEASLRRDALASARPSRLAALIAAHLPEGGAYFNAGHANLSETVLAALAAAGLSRNVVVHDTIPLDHPEFSRPEAIAAFAGRIRATSALADRVIYVSAATEAAAGRHFAGFGRTPPGLVAPIGVSPATPGELPPGLPPPGAYFVTLGTIEPRKNHALLLDIWDEFHATLPETGIPSLLILGSRGWGNEALFRRLDNASFVGRTVHEIADLPDAAVATLVAGAAGLLFPSRAEGFGLPPLEAAALGTPVVAAPLPVYRETLGDIAVYAGPDDRYSWAQSITRLAAEHGRAGQPRARRGTFEPPGWDRHFKLVLTTN